MRDTNTRVKLLAAGLAASLSFFAYKAKWEGERLEPYYDSARIPTIGIGTTQYPPYYMGGKKVSINDPRITKQQSRAFSEWHSRKDAEFLRKSLPNVYLTQQEFDIYLDFIYQFGRAAWQGSTMRKELLRSAVLINPQTKREAYLRSCDALLKWRKVRINGRLVDCAVPANRCTGVWKRQLWRKEQCYASNTGNL